MVGRSSRYEQGVDSENMSFIAVKDNIGAQVFLNLQYVRHIVVTDIVNYHQIAVLAPRIVNVLFENGDILENLEVEYRDLQRLCEWSAR